MAGRAAVIVEIDALLDRCRDKPQHLRAIVMHNVSRQSRQSARDAEIDAKPSPKSADAAGNAMPIGMRLPIL